LDEVKNHCTINWGDPDDPEESSVEKGRLVSQEIFNASNTGSTGMIHLIPGVCYMYVIHAFINRKVHAHTINMYHLYTLDVV